MSLSFAERLRVHALTATGRIMVLFTPADARAVAEALIAAEAQAAEIARLRAQVDALVAELDRARGRPAPRRGALSASLWPWSSP